MAKEIKGYKIQKRILETKVLKNRNWSQRRKKEAEAILKEIRNETFPTFIKDFNS